MTREALQAATRIAGLARTDFELTRLKLARAARAARAARQEEAAHQATLKDRAAPDSPFHGALQARWEIWHRQEAARLARARQAAEAARETAHVLAGERFARARAADHLRDRSQAELHRAAERAAERNTPAPPSKPALTSGL